MFSQRREFGCSLNLTFTRLYFCFRAPRRVWPIVACVDCAVFNISMYVRFPCIWKRKVFDNDLPIPVDCLVYAIMEGRFAVPSERRQFAPVQRITPVVEGTICFCKFHLPEIVSRTKVYRYCALTSGPCRYSLRLRASSVILNSSLVPILYLLRC